MSRCVEDFQLHPCKFQFLSVMHELIRCKRHHFSGNVDRQILLGIQKKVFFLPKCIYFCTCQVSKGIRTTHVINMSMGQECRCNLDALLRCILNNFIRLIPWIKYQRFFCIFIDQKPAVHCQLTNCNTGNFYFRHHISP